MTPYLLQNNVKVNSVLQPELSLFHCVAEVIQVRQEDFRRGLQWSPVTETSCAHFLCTLGQLPSLN